MGAAEDRDPGVGGPASDLFGPVALEGRRTHDDGEGSGGCHESKCNPLIDYEATSNDYVIAGERPVCNHLGLGPGPLGGFDSEDGLNGLTEAHLVTDERAAGLEGVLDTGHLEGVGGEPLGHDGREVEVRLGSLG